MKKERLCTKLKERSSHRKQRTSKAVRLQLCVIRLRFQRVCAETFLCVTHIAVEERKRQNPLGDKEKAWDLHRAHSLTVRQTDSFTHCLLSACVCVY